MPRADWERLKAGAGCVMCADVHLDDNPLSALVADLDCSYVRFPKNQYQRGWTILVLKRHASELWELDEAELAGFWREVARVAQALDRIYQPAKINYGVFGSLCPHLHCHLVPQTYEDDPHKPLNMQERDVRLPDDEYAQAVVRLRREILGT
jgi:diadenosine tetraphosphate (Ap4A) HIT family hydrolase